MTSARPFLISTSKLAKTLPACVLAFATLSFPSLALAGSTSVGATATFDRDPDDLGVAKDAKIELNAAHTFDVGVILGGSAVYKDTAFSDKATVNLETTIGHRLKISEMFSVIGSVGIGEHFQVSGSGDDFAYYVLRAAADVKLDDRLTWNAVAFRYRDASTPTTTI